MTSRLKEAIQGAEARKTAIGHFNVGNLEQLKAIAHAGIRMNVPVIVGVSEGEREYLGVHHIVDFVRSYNREHATRAQGGGFELFLNADHTHSLEKVREAAEAGFDAILFDGAKLQFHENVAKTREAVGIAAKVSPNIVVEGELGYIGGASEILKEIPEGAAIRPEDFTDPRDAREFVRATGVDLLAPAVGNIHGMFSNAKNPALDIARIRAIREKAGVPLVLHGGSGVTDKDFTRAIAAGVSIIHISTELRYLWRKELEEELKSHPEEIAPYKVMPGVIRELERHVEARLRLFNRRVEL